MKRGAMLLLITVLIAAPIGLFQVPAHAEGLNIVSGEGDTVAFFKDIQVTEPLHGDVVCIFGDIVVKGDIDGSVVSIFGDVTIDARISDDAAAIMGNMRLRDNAVVMGDAVTIGGRLEMSGLAKIKGKTVEIILGPAVPGVELFITLKIILVVVSAVFILLAGILLVALSGPGLEQYMAEADRRIFEILAKGMLVFLIMVILLPLLFITIIYPILFMAAIVMAGVFSSICFGRVILRTFGSRFGLFADFITGFTTITVLRVLLAGIVPGGTILLNLAALLLFEFFVNSLGVGFITGYRSIRKKPENLK